MAALTHGLSSFTFGVSGLSGYVVQSHGTSTAPQVVAEVFDESGIRKHVRYDDNTTELSFEGILQGATLPVAGDALTFGGLTWEVLSVELKRANKDFAKVAIKGKRSSAITPA